MQPYIRQTRGPGRLLSRTARRDAEEEGAGSGFQMGGGPDVVTHRRLIALIPRKGEDMPRQSGEINVRAGEEVLCCLKN